MTTVHHIVTDQHRIQAYRSGQLVIDRQSEQAAGIVGWWPLGSTPNIGRDYSGRNHHGTLVGTPVLHRSVHPKMGGLRSVDFDGGADYLDLGSAPSFVSDLKGTVTAWVHLDLTSAQNDQIIGYGGSNVSDEFFGVRTRGNGSSNFVRIQGWGGANDTLDGPAEIGAQVWTHVAVVSDGSTWTLYYNGIQKNLSVIAGSNSGDWFGDTSPGSPLVTLAAIKFSNSVSQHFNGRLTDVRLYNVPLTPQQVRETWQRPYRLWRPAASRTLFLVTAPTPTPTLQPNVDATLATEVNTDGSLTTSGQDATLTTGAASADAVL